MCLCSLLTLYIYFLASLVVMNKCLTILLNVAIWDQHAKPGGIFCLFVCIAGGMLYQQAPMKGEKKQIPTGVTADDDKFKAGAKRQG